ncbi:hypothetical protein [Arthrobacter alpinus]|uniref:hypothetical protein n=1 Tax=Arthrobacter alpinus TaxID=656366 RepID=UPI0009431C66|nr:hypothetical protein [Arthrobacter alpinus]
MITNAHRTTSVGAAELNELKERWNDYRALINPGIALPFDPLVALRLCGAVLNAVPSVLETAEYTPSHD